MKRATLFFVLALALPQFASAAYSDISIKPNGELVVTNLTVVQKSGTTLYVRANWESTFIRLVITTSAATDIKKNHGEKATVADVEVGHVLDVEGALVGGGDSITVTARKIRDTALVRESKTFSGAVKSVDARSQSFVVADKSLGDVTVVVPGTVTIMQGKRQLAFGDVKTGMKVVSMTGTYDYGTKILAPTAIELYQDASVFKPKNFQGTLKSISSASLPAQLTVNVDGTEHTIYLDSKATVLNKNRAASTLRRFAEGDVVRFYGAIRETNFSEVDAEVVRNLNF